MTTFHLFLWLLGGLLLQVALFLIIVFWQHWLNYLSLQGTLQESTNSSSPQKSNVEAPSHVAAWKGLRTFRVERKVLEGAAEQVCSFYLSPKDGQLLPSFLPGQFLTFQLAIEGYSYADKPLTRCYSLSNSPNADLMKRRRQVSSRGGLS
jgi:hypothetical protein